MVLQIKKMGLIEENKELKVEYYTEWVGEGEWELVLEHFL